MRIDEQVCSVSDHHRRVVAPISNRGFAIRNARNPNKTIIGDTF
jgi:hypothetical protein